jgi:hypothetical protein
MDRTGHDVDESVKLGKSAITFRGAADIDLGALRTLDERAPDAEPLS